MDDPASVTASGCVTGRALSSMLKQEDSNVEVQIIDDQGVFVREAIQTGRFSREDDVLHEALSMWEERERWRAETLAAIDEAEASLARGEGLARLYAGTMSDDVRVSTIAGMSLARGAELMSPTVGRNPPLGRRRDHGLRARTRMFFVGEYVILYRSEGGTTIILHVMRRSRIIVGLAGE